MEIYLVHGNQMQSARMVRGVGQRGCQHIEPLRRISGLCRVKIHVMLGSFGECCFVGSTSASFKNRVGPMSEFGEHALIILPSKRSLGDHGGLIQQWIMWKNAP